MTDRDISALTLKLVAFSSAFGDMLASLSYENLVLRELLVTRGQISEDDYQEAVQRRGREDWELQRNRVQKRVRDLTSEALERLQGGDVVH